MVLYQFLAINMRFSRRADTNVYRLLAFLGYLKNMLDK